MVLLTAASIAIPLMIAGPSLATSAAFQQVQRDVIETPAPVSLPIKEDDASDNAPSQSEDAVAQPDENAIGASQTRSDKIIVSFNGTSIDASSLPYNRRVRHLYF